MQQIINDLKKYDWQFIINFGNSLEELNDRQLRFLKGFVCEELIAMQDSSLICVREDHKDFDWPKHNTTIELKSQLSQSMYKKNGKSRKTFIVKFTNSNGTNNKDMLEPELICDITIVLRNDGCFLVDKETVIRNLHKTGDGFDLKINLNDIKEISGYVVANNKYNVDLNNALQTAVRGAITRAKNVQ
jgi:hypothetical protein